MTKNTFFEINVLKNSVIPNQINYFYDDTKNQSQIWDNLKIFKCFTKRKILKMSTFCFENGQVSFFLELVLFLIFQRDQIPRLVKLTLKEILEAFPKLGFTNYIEKITFLLYKLTNRNLFIHKVSNKFIFLLKILFESKGIKSSFVEYKQKAEKFDITNEEMEIHLEHIRMKVDNFDFSGAGIYMNRIFKKNLFDYFPKNFKTCFYEHLIHIFFKSANLKQITKLYFSRFENQEELGVTFKNLLELNMAFFYFITSSNFLENKQFVLLVSFRILDEHLERDGTFLFFCSNCIFPRTWSFVKKLLPKFGFFLRIFLENSSLNFFRCLRAISIYRNLDIFYHYFSSIQIKNISLAMEIDDRDTEHWFYKNFGGERNLIKIEYLKKKIKIKKNF